MSNLAYRPDIDGLRALAVISVLLYHAEFSVASYTLFKGGYIGVDIFFVISGYLITKILLTEIQHTGSINIKSFYDRRARRILPPLFLVMITAIPFAHNFLLPLDLSEFKQSALAAIFFVSNFFFYGATTSYGADSSLLKPLLHTWSLGVEEQFYFFLPVFLICITKYFNRQLNFIFFILLGISFSSAVFMGYKNPELNFFLTTSRMWELFFGAIVAKWHIDKAINAEQKYSYVLSLAGLAAIAWAILSFDASTRHPGILTAVPVLGAALMISNQSKTGVVFKILRNSVLVFIGKLSYSIYLWHFPIFAFSRAKNLSPDNGDKLTWVALTLALSYISYRFIETPFRNHTKIRSIFVWSLLFSISVCFVAFGVNDFGVLKKTKPAVELDVAVGESIFREKISNQPAQTPHPLKVLAYEDFLTSPAQRLKKNGFPCHGMGPCYFLEGNAESTRIAFIGDSHMSSIALQLNRSLPNISKMFEMYGGCPYALEVFRILKGKIHFCSKELQARRLKNIEKFDPDIVVVMGSYHQINGKDKQIQFINEDGVEDAIEGVRRGTLQLLSNGYHVIQLYPLPVIPWNLPKKILAESPKDLSGQKQYLKENPITTSYDLFRHSANAAFEVFDAVNAENFHRVHPHKLFCNEIPGSQCVTHDLNYVYYWDSNHPSNKGAELISEIVVDKVRFVEALLSKNSVL